MHKVCEWVALEDDVCGVTHCKSSKRRDTSGARTLHLVMCPRRVPASTQNPGEPARHSERGVHRDAIDHKGSA